LDELREARGTESYTVALLEEEADCLFPERLAGSQGASLFVKKVPQTLDVRNFRLVNNDKFDFMRKVIAFMAAQKKIQRVIGQKVPELYPRSPSDVAQAAYLP
jgi:hypothetical protein